MEVFSGYWQITINPEEWHKSAFTLTCMSLTALKEAGAKLKISKYSFFSVTVEYLGHIILPGALEVCQVNVKSLKNAEQPTKNVKLRGFLGLCNGYGRFISQ